MLVGQSLESGHRHVVLHTHSADAELRPGIAQLPGCSAGLSSFSPEALPQQTTSESGTTRFLQSMMSTSTPVKAVALFYNHKDLDFFSNHTDLDLVNNLFVVYYWGC
eukprot:scpid51652/ scgid29514/ 